MRILISAGEVSGDVVAALVARELRRRDPACHLYGLGGARLAAAGVDLVASTAHLGCVGITEAFGVAPGLVECWRALAARVARDPPDLALLVGNDFFHILLARRLRARGVPVASLFPPQVWVWRSVAGIVARSYDLILASFPEEEQVYRAAGGRVEFVGHYLADALMPVTAEARASARRSLAIDTDARVVGLLPGSRAHEIRRVGPALWGAAARLLARDPHLRFVLPVADARFRPVLEQAIGAHGLTRAVRLCEPGLTAMRASDLLLVASGTATLEATLLRVPMVIAYRLSAVTYALARALLAGGAIDSATVGAPNLALGSVRVPELVQHRLSASSLADEAWALLSNHARLASQRETLADAAARFTREGALRRVGDALVAAASPARIRSRDAQNVPARREESRRARPAEARR